MKLIVGLGNPGEKFEKTRHNLGFRVIDELHQNLEFSSWNLAKKFNTLISENMLKGKKIILAKPQTFMNSSGQVVKALVDYYKIKSPDILIIHDDIDLPLGEIRLQKSRGSAGHKGVQSIIDALGTKDFARLRIGIRPNLDQKTETEKFVLEKFTNEEEKIIQQTLKKATEKISVALFV
jgi:PTH1 family peptidyl-tRNA hydrolase